MNKRQYWPSLLAVLLLWAFFTQTVTSMVVKSPTVDEQAHLMRGYVYLELGDLRFKIGHPILANALNAFPLWMLTDLTLPTDDPAWQENRWGAFSDRFIWRQGNNVDLIFFPSRLVTVALGMLLATLVFRWARQLWGKWAGLVALTLFVFDPTIVAHSRLTTDDVAVSFFYFAATYGLWRYLEKNRPRDLVLAGVAFGVGQGCKFSALLLIPVLVAVTGLWPSLRSTTTASRRWLLSHALSLLAIFTVGGLMLWAGYRFDFGSVPGWSVPVPAPAYFEDLIWEIKYLGRGGHVFLCGDYSDTGWWYYFLVALALKSPLPAIILIGAALISLRQGANRSRLLALLLPAFVYFLSTLVVSLNIGYRFFIPALPYLYVLTGRLAASAKRYQHLLVAGALAWNAVIALCIHPHYLAYFNELAGGPDNGWRCLIDSNIDWGQDLPALRDTVERDDLGRIKLSYFGTAHPSYYGLDFEPLPTWDPTPEQGNPLTRTYYPHNPAPGIYAISATHLQGVVMDPDEWDTYAWFRDRQPFAKAGYSIFLYRVEPTGPPTDVALSGLQIDELTPETFAAFGTNDVRLRWFDARTSLVIPPQPAWYAIRGTGDSPIGQVPPEKPGSHAYPCTTTAGHTCRLYAPDPAAHTAARTRVEGLTAASRAWRSPALVPLSDEQISPLALPANLGDQLEFLGYEPHDHPPNAAICDLQSAACSILTAWRVIVSPDGPRAIFVHLLAPDGRVAAQWDGLDVPTEGWREGDTVLQTASFDLPGAFLPGRYWLQTGVYDPVTMERLPVLVEGVSVADRVLLSSVRVEDTQ